jgi:hypothetical protein
MNPLAEGKILDRRPPSKRLMLNPFRANIRPPYLEAGTLADLNIFHREASMKKKPVFLCLSGSSKDEEIRRNYLCPEYDECLDQAAYNDSDLDCTWCVLRDQKQLDAVFPEACMPGYRMLLECIFS